MNLFIIIAGFNEERKIGRVLAGLKKEGYKNIVVVDDGSSDRTFEISQKAGAHALRHIINRGQGAALKTGIDYALSKKADILVTFDADGQFRASEVKDIIKPIIDKKADITLGSRFLGKAVNMPSLKKAVLRAGIFVVFIMYGIKVTDSQCGFRALSREAAEKIDLSSDRMEHAAEFFSEIMKHRLKYKEVPVTVIYDKYSLGKGQSWTKSFNIGLRMIFRRMVK